MNDKPKIDCLMEVTAQFFKVGQKVPDDYCDEEYYTFASYGEWDDVVNEEYWDYDDAMTDECGRVTGGLVIKKDFTGFVFCLVFSGDFADGLVSGVRFDAEDMGLDFMLRGHEGTLDAHAREVKLECDRARREQPRPDGAPLLPEETDRVKFILALTHQVTAYPPGPWGPEEYDSDIAIAGRIDMSRLLETLV